MANRRLGKYEILERLGRGGMAEVYRAYHASLDRYVAIKILHTFLADDPEFKNRFEKEAQSVARLKHPHIVQVYDFDYDSEDDSYYMVMELVEGPTLKDRLAELTATGALLPYSEVLRIMTEAASALAYAHSQGMIHRDVKPANLMLDQGRRVVLTDFGIAKMLTGQQLTTTGGMVGTPAYMGPEQGMGQTGDERSDLYSLGVIFFELLAGRLPYIAETPVAMIMKHLNDPIPSAAGINTSLPSAVDTVIARMLAKEPDERYQRVIDFMADLKRLRTGQSMASSELSRTPPKPAAPKPLAAAVQPPQVPPAVSPDDDLATIIITPRPEQHPVGPEPERVSGPPRQRIPWWGWLGSILIIAVVGLGSFLLGNTVRLPGVAILPTDTPTPSLTTTVEPSDVPVVVPAISPTASATFTPTLTPSPPTVTSTPTSSPTVKPSSSPTMTLTRAPTSAPTSTNTVTPTITDTPSATPNATETLAYIRTATVAACQYDYAIVEQTPGDGADGGFFPVNTDYERTIVFRNTGTCAWEPNTSLAFVSGQNFNVGPRILIREQVEPSATVELVFKGKLPAKGSQTPLQGVWELRTPGQILIGKPITISILVYEQ